MSDKNEVARDAKCLMQEANEFKNSGHDNDLRELAAEHFYGELVKIAEKEKVCPGYFASVANEMKHLSDDSWFNPRVELVGSKEAPVLNVQSNFGDVLGRNHYELNGWMDFRHMAKSTEVFYWYKADNNIFKKSHMEAGLINGRGFHHALVD